MINLKQIRKHPELKKHMEQANTEILMNEAEYAAIELRKCLEYMLKKYCVKYGVMQEEASVNDMIKNLKEEMSREHISSDVLNSDDIYLFYDIKSIGNKGAHDNEVSIKKVEAYYYCLEEFLPKFLKAFDQD